jgi:hypothetical protein
MLFKKKVIYFLSVFFALLKAPFALSITAHSVLKKFQIDYTFLKYPLHFSGQVTLFTPVYQSQKTSIWVNGRYMNQHSKNMYSVFAFEKLNGGFGGRYLSHPKWFWGAYFYIEELWGKRYLYDGNQEPTHEEKWLYVNPGIEWVSQWAKFNVDSYYLWKNRDDCTPFLITNQQGVNFKLSSTIFRKLNPFIIAYFSKINRYIDSYRPDWGVNSQIVKGWGIGINYILYSYCTLEIAPIIYDTLQKYSFMFTLSIKGDKANPNMSNMYRKLKQPLNRYQPLYVGSFASR